MAPAAVEFPGSSSSFKRVCVMDAGGCFGSALVHRLLQRGYIVHAAISSHVEMQSMAGDSKNLRVFHTDPLDYHSIVEALEGCYGLFYSFQPPSDHPSYDESMAEMEVRAAHNVLEACAQTDTIDKVVFTSSATAVLWRDPSDSTPSSQDVDERNWSNVNFCKKFKLWHGLSKTLAEKTAWALAMDRGVSMVTINAGLLLSPDLTITHPYLKGAAEMYEDGVFVTVDLKFLVDSHICVFEDVSAYGRYLCFNRVVNCNEDAVKLAQILLPPDVSSLPPSITVGESRMVPQRISNKKLNKLMVNFDSQVPTLSS
ncbi:putative cinnamoyl-CoA reductase [Helianthus annuus]|uniref:Cinnamoyl-CoA reductase n=1 Tax=Helianthus annuus TaxID=4232 RepID=A0A251RYP9_HELAN|nr:cinnamoyl-CoA reductase-like SNL6 [Helianthus annuus]KAF5759698.1 putative cinnamoyl-CoA reductase [Helianthus annuus]KAJ0437856.1 putative cinnamoyl-CoA reductase [Helianthus annuus]KAJ0442426.1 putative cinnamoyl-CoA reductase [Helianthus annuus]KAJ0460181.1 putative cinnamoyl-CoA reductase [Helianthus annuus]KAJ0640622.1 putative cinnamoyl-CoA reductase [Helianthus annuus]